MTAYDDGVEHLRDELRRLDLLLQRYLAAWRADRGGAGEGGGLYVSDAQVDRLLRSDPVVGARDDGSQQAQTGEETVDTWGAMTGRDGTSVEQSIRGDTVASRGGGESVEERLRTFTEMVRQREKGTTATDTELPLRSLADRFGLNQRHVDALLVALAPELDLKYETVYAYLQDDLTRKRPTVGLVLRVVGGTIGSETDERALFIPRSPLLDHRLLRLPAQDGALLSQTVEVDRRIIAWLLGEDELDRGLGGVAEHVDPRTVRPPVAAPDTDETTPSLDRLPVTRVTRDRLRTVCEHVAGNPATIVHLCGPYGSGRRAAVAALADALGRELVAIDAEQIPEENHDYIISLLIREAKLRDSSIHVRNLPPPAHKHEEPHIIGLATLLNQLDEFEGPVFLSGEDRIPPRLSAQLNGHAFATVELERPPFSLRQALWDQVDLPGDPSDLASKFLFTPGEIADAATTAGALAFGDPTADDVYEACRIQSRERLQDLARQIEPIHGWEDIVLPDDRMRQLREVAAHIEHHGTVYSEWGFEDRFSLGTGVNVLFAGPSGTGKTMAAEILAGEAGLDLYKIDLANVVSKYIGETESNLGRVFDEAEASNAVLFFDEADALFGKRSEVSDAHDRYANVEVDYLLERMEEHDSVVLLATNLEENIDGAFQRRLNLTIEFPLPDRDARERIWRGVFPDKTPVGDLDWRFLAEFDLTGGDIKNAALTAAFLAADDGADTVEMRHAVTALWRELQKGSRLVSADDFGKYRGYLP